MKNKSVMNDILRSRRIKYLLFLLILATLTGGFYWFQIRPAKMRIYCAKQVAGFGSTGTSIEKREFAYKTCLRVRGLE